MEYDNNNRGATFPPRPKQKMLFQGNGEIDNKPHKFVVVADESRDGKPFKEVYVKAGAIFNNSYKEPNDKKPHYTGKLEMFEKRIACWKQTKGDMNYLSFRITEPQENVSELDDEIPFGKELDKMADDLKKEEKKDVDYDW